MIPQSVFLDTNFLIASQQKSHVYYRESRVLLKDFYNSNLIPVAHPLIFDEFWYVFMGLYKDYPSIKMYKFLIEATNRIFAFKNFQILKTSLSKEDLLITLKVTHKRKLRPRDAMIVSIMQKESIKKIASFDTDFDCVSGITRLY